MTPGFQNLPIQSSSYDGQNIVITAPVIYITRAGETIIIPIGATSDGPARPVKPADGKLRLKPFAVTVVSW